MSDYRPEGRNAAFTLIELLVVIAIVSILAAILFPVFAQAREKARQTQCVSNLRQFGMATMMYTQDFDETLPLYSYGDRLHYWIGSRAVVTQTLDPTQSLIYPYVKNGNLQKCPSYIGASNLGGMGFGINSQLMYHLSTFGANIPAPLGVLTQPAQTILFGDAGIPNWAGGTVGETIQIDPPYWWQPSPTIDFRHLGMADFTYCDGHVKPIGKAAFTQVLPVNQQNPAQNIYCVGDLLMARQ